MILNVHFVIHRSNDELQSDTLVTKVLHQVVTAKIPKQVCGHSSEFTKGKKSPIKRYSMRKYHKQIFLHCKKYFKKLDLTEKVVNVKIPQTNIFVKNIAKNKTPQKKEVNLKIFGSFSFLWGTF